MLDYLVSNLPIFLLEFLAALAGTLYIKKNENPGYEFRLIVAFLWLSFFVEITALYTLVAYYTEYEYFGFVQNTNFRRNFWLYNIRNIIEYLVYIIFFFNQLKSSGFKKIMRYIAFLFIPAMILNLIFSGVYFEAYSQFTSLLSTFMYVTLILRYFYEMLQSEEILYFYRSMPFYISTGVLLWYLAITPFIIYSKYYERPNMEFVEIQRLTFFIMNIFFYSWFIFGFIFCSSKRETDKVLTG